jgi:Tfp pilus assembly protein PilF
VCDEKPEQPLVAPTPLQLASELRRKSPRDADAQARQSMDKITPDAFVRVLGSQVLGGKDPKFAFLLGAGCSVSSGIPSASSLAEKWLRALKQQQMGSADGWDEWGRSEFGYKAGPGEAYSAIIKRLFPTSMQQQLEIESVIDVRDPIGFGYITLASLMTHANLGERFDVALTTNFDDLLADSCYLYTKIKPRVIPHESLSEFVRASQTRPLIVKLHGDARLGPKNTEEQLRKLGRSLGKAVSQLMNDRGLLINGYSGNDIGVASILSSLPKNACPWGVYWVNAHAPGEALAHFLKERGAIWVQDSNFDRLMALLFDHFGLRPPDMSRLTQQTAHYRRVALSVCDTLSGAGPVDQAIASFKDRISEWSAVEDAWRLADVDTEEATAAFNNIVATWPNSAMASREAGWFHCDQKNDLDLAERLFQHSLAADKASVSTLAGLAWVAFRRRDVAVAERYYERAITAGPKDPLALSLYGWFLAFEKRDYTRAEQQLVSALKENPTYHLAHKNYGFLLLAAKADVNAAERHFRRAVECKPNSGVSRSVLAVFLNNHRGQTKEALELARQALLDEPSNSDCLANYAMLLFQEGRIAQARVTLRKLRSLAMPPSVRAEVLFYEYAHDSDRRAAALDELQRLMSEGVRSEGWDFSRAVAVAIANKHPDEAMLRRLADLASGKSSGDALGA